ncbi:MAG: hypothetical protein CMD39_07420 [Gammaproteobacteria bacterium]|nr:hypothetical protein [Gammaproteobacteria bacterium]
MERRKHARQPSTATVRAHLPDGRETAGSLLDVGTHGARLWLPDVTLLFDRGDQLVIAIDDVPGIWTADVRWSRTSPSQGVEVGVRIPGLEPP